MGIGAKDQSNYLVAGLHRNFPQDSCNSEKKNHSKKQFYKVKRMIRGIGIETILTYSQTLNR